MVKQKESTQKSDVGEADTSEGAIPSEATGNEEANTIGEHLC